MVVENLGLLTRLISQTKEKVYMFIKPKSVRETPFGEGKE